MNGAKKDVVIIGGGLLGAALALELSGRRADVLIAERDQVNQHASGRNAGSLHFQLEYRMVSRGPEHARRAAEAIPLHIEAAKYWQQLAATIGPEIGLSQRGGLMLASSARSVGLLEEKAQLERSWGLDVSVLDRDEIQRLAPYLSDSVVAAAFCPIEGKANTRRAAAALSRAAIAKGAEVSTGTEVLDVRRSGDGWRLTLQKNGELFTVSSDVVVLAAGAWCDDLARMMGARIPVDPVSLYMLVTARAEPLIPHLIQHVDARLSLKQSGEGNVLLGGGWPAPLIRRADGSVDPAARPDLDPSSIAGNARAAVRAVPAIASFPIIRSWVGTTTVAPDQLPVVGEIPGAPGAFVATGGAVFTLGPVFARLLTQLIDGRDPDIDLRPYAVDRFERGELAAHGPVAS